MSTLLRIIITLIPTAALFYARRFLPVDPGTIKIGPFTLIEVLAVIVLLFLFWFLISPGVCRFLQGLRFKLVTLRKIRRQIRSRQRSLLNWLLSRSAHWGITGTASEPQYAAAPDSWKRNASPIAMPSRHSPKQSFPQDFQAVP